LDSPRRSRSPGTATLALSQQQSLQERLRLREERKQQEELLKAFETPEEKRARRLAKKEAKERKKREKMGWGEEYMGYTNTDNPFGDNNLLGTFIWNKALEKKGISHLEEKELKERNKRIQEDNRLELQKVGRPRTHAHLHGSSHPLLEAGCAWTHASHHGGSLCCCPGQTAAARAGTGESHEGAGAGVAAAGEGGRTL
jgi:hypothetical protein